MYKIYVENIRSYSYHGCLEEETVIGGNYVVDVVVSFRNDCQISFKIHVDKS